MSAAYTDTLFASNIVGATSLTLSPVVLELNAGDAASFSVTLPSAPLRNVVLAVSPVAGVTPGFSVVFTPANWQTPQTVPITTRAFTGPDRIVSLQVAGSGYFPQTVAVTLHGQR